MLVESAGFTVLAFLIGSSPNTPSLTSAALHARKAGQVKPQVVGVEVRVTVLVSEIVHLVARSLGGVLRKIMHNHYYAPPRVSTTTNICQKYARTHLSGVGAPLAANQPATLALGAEASCRRWRWYGILEGGIDQFICQTRAVERSVNVTVAGRAPLSGDLVGS